MRTVTSGAKPRKQNHSKKLVFFFASDERREVHSLGIAFGVGIEEKGKVKENG
jgi:hypothetical protein